MIIHLYFVLKILKYQCSRAAVSCSPARSSTHTRTDTRPPQLICLFIPIINTPFYCVSRLPWMINDLDMLYRVQEGIIHYDNSSFSESSIDFMRSLLRFVYYRTHSFAIAPSHKRPTYDLKIYGLNTQGV